MISTTGGHYKHNRLYSASALKTRQRYPTLHYLRCSPGGCPPSIPPSVYFRATLSRREHGPISEWVSQIICCLFISREIREMKAKRREAGVDTEFSAWARPMVFFRPYRAQKALETRVPRAHAQGYPPPSLREDSSESTMHAIPGLRIETGGTHSLWWMKKRIHCACDPRSQNRDRGHPFGNSPASLREDRGASNDFAIPGLRIQTWVTQSPSRVWGGLRFVVSRPSEAWTGHPSIKVGGGIWLRFIR